MKAKCKMLFKKALEELYARRTAAGCPPFTVSFIGLDTTGSGMFEIGTVYEVIEDDRQDPVSFLNLWVEKPGTSAAFWVPDFAYDIIEEEELKNG